MVTINLLRISPDSKYLEFDVECDTDYVFNLLQIRHYNDPIDEWIDCSVLLSGTTTKEVIRILVESINGNDGGDNMFYVKFGTSYVPLTAEPLVDGVLPSTLFTSGVCSDLSNVFFSLYNKIISLDATSISRSDYDALERIYMLSYAHSEALRLERFSDAETFYTKIQTQIQSTDFIRQLDGYPYTK